MEKFISGFRKIQKFNRVILALALLIMIAVVFLQTFCRFVIFQSLTWSEELSRYLFVVVIVLGVNLATTDHLFVRIEIIDNYLGKTGKFLLDIIRKFVAIYVSAIFIYSGYELVKVGSYQISPAMSVPMSLLYATIFLGFVLNLIAVYIDTYEHFIKEEKE